MKSDKLLFSKKHIWIENENGIAKIGITDYAQSQLGDIMFLNLPELEENLEIGKVFGDIESIKTVSELISPVSGKVIAIHEAIVDEPNKINESANENWLIKVEIKDMESELMDYANYIKYKESL